MADYDERTIQEPKHGAAYSFLGVCLQQRNMG